MNTLQATATEKLLEGDVFGFIIDTLTGIIPIPILALLIFGAIGVSFYMTQNSFIIPGIMLMLIGGVTIAEAPPTAFGAIYGVLIIAAAGIGFIVINRFRN